MRAFLFPALIAVLAVSPTLFAADEAEVKEIDLKELKRGPQNGDVRKPSEITSAEQVAKVFPEEELAERLKKETDFAKTKLLFFSWSGSGQDKLTAAAEKGKDGTELVFTHLLGRTRDLRGHFRLFAVPKDMPFRVVQKTP